jgi:hypothetical protein
MSKASQRKEAERRKRLEQKHGARGAKLMARIEKHGAEALESAHEVMEALGEIGPVVKATAATKRLHSLANAFRPTVKSLWDEMTCWEDFDGEDYALEVPAFIAFWDKNDELLGVLPSRPVSQELLEEHDSFEGVIRWMFETAEGKLLGEPDVAAWVVGDSPRQDFATFCLLATKDGATKVAHVLVEGRWVAARVPDKVWFAGFIAAENAGESFWGMPEIQRLVNDAENREQQGTAEDRRRWLGVVASRVMERHVELWWRLLGGLKAAEEEAEAAWAAADEDQRVEGTQLEEARALGRQEVVDKLKQVEAALASAREEIERLRRGEQVAGRPEIQPQVAVEAARIPAPPQDAAEEVMRRVAAFF